MADWHQSAGSGGLLSAIERALLQALASGQSLHEAASHLAIEADAARFQLRSAMGKLDARTEEQAVAIALTTGEIDPSGLV